MTILAVVVTLAASMLCGVMNAGAAGYSTTKSNIKNLGAEQCDPKADKNCSTPPATKAPESANGVSAPGGKVVSRSDVEVKANASKGVVERPVAIPAPSRSVSGTIPPRTANSDPKAGGTQRTGDPLPDVDVSLDRKTGGNAARVRAP